MGSAWRCEERKRSQSLFLCCRLGFGRALLQLVCIKLKGLLKEAAKQRQFSNQLFPNKLCMLTQFYCVFPSRISSEVSGAGAPPGSV